MEKNQSMVIGIVVVLVVVGGAIYFSTNNKKESSPVETGTISGQVTSNQNTTVDNTNTTSTSENSASKETTKPKEEAKPAQIAKSGDIVAMNYTGKLTNGTVFDSNLDPKFKHVEPLVFQLGVGQVIKGWDEGIVGMKVGEKKTMTIPADKAYGARAVGAIPANSILIFDVELVAIKPAQ